MSLSSSLLSWPTYILSYTPNFSSSIVVFFLLLLALLHLYFLSCLLMLTLLMVAGLVISSPPAVPQDHSAQSAVTKSYLVNVHSLFHTSLGFWVIKVHQRFTLLLGLGLIAVTVFTGPV